MSSNLPRYRQRRFRRLPLAARIGLLALAGCLAVGALVVAITDGPPMLYARADGGSQVDDFTTDDATSDPDTGTTPSDVPVATPTPTPSDSPSPDSSDGSPDSDSDSDSDSDDSSGSSDDDSSDSSDDSDYSATSPPREPDSPRPTDPSDPTDDPSEPSEEPSDDPSGEPSSEPTEPGQPIEPTVEPSEPTEPTPDDPGLPFIELSRSEERLLDSADDARIEAGCPALRIDPRLTVAARGHSEDMRDRRYYAHVNPDGATPQDRAADEGYTAEVAENLAYGLRSADQVVRDWDGEELDRLLDCSYTSVGIGLERGLLSSWWTVMLGTA